MDEGKDLHEVKRRGNNGETPAVINYGNWKIEFSRFGFIVKNTTSPHRFHFHKESNGWISGQTTKGMQMFNGFGPMPEGLPVEFDKPMQILEKLS